MITPVSSEYIKDQRKQYFLYTISDRAIPHLSDGLKASQRRGLWIGRNGDKMKTSSLAGATMPLHPHSEISDVLSNMAGVWSNNIPLLTGYGAFGTMLAPGSYGAPRYTSVKVSEFTKDVVFKDIEIIPMQPNYDDTLEEPLYFLPLVPIVLLNPSFGMTGGFKCNILPFDLKDIINAQLSHLNKKTVNEVLPFFKPIECRAVSKVDDVKTKNSRYVFEGEFKQLNSSEIQITKLPYGVVHKKYVEHLDSLEEDFKIVGYDDLSKDKINIIVKFARGFVNKTSNEDMIKLLQLYNAETEIMNVVYFDGETVLNTTFVDVIQKFTDWRLAFYTKRYQRLVDLLDIEIQKFRDVITAIEKNVNGVATRTKSKSELEEYLEYIGIVYLDYISSLPVYRFTEDEKHKVEQKLQSALDQREEYVNLLTFPEKRVNVYINELKEVLKKYG
jgi:DNA topoisomerase-2